MSTINCNNFSTCVLQQDPSENRTRVSRFAAARLTTELLGHTKKCRNPRLEPLPPSQLGLRWEIPPRGRRVAIRSSLGPIGANTTSSLVTVSSVSVSAQGTQWIAPVRTAPRWAPIYRGDTQPQLSSIRLRSRFRPPSSCMGC